MSKRQRTKDDGSSKPTLSTEESPPTTDEKAAAGGKRKTASKSKAAADTAPAAAAASAVVAKEPVKPSAIGKTDPSVKTMPMAEFTKWMADEALAEKQRATTTTVPVGRSTDAESEAGGEVKWVRVRNLCGWEKEEWFRWYPLKTKEERVAWTALAATVHARNAKARATCWSDAKEQFMKDWKSQDRVMWQLLAGEFIMGSSPNTFSSEFYISFHTEAERKTLTTAPVRAWGKPPKDEDEDDGDEDESDNDDDDEDVDLCGRVETHAARTNAAFLYRQWFFKIGMQSMYTHKHTLYDSSPATERLLELATASDDDVFKAFYKGREI